MSKEKNSQVDDLTKLRRILDNSSNASIGSLVSTDEVTLESVRRRLQGDTLKTQYQAHRLDRPYTSLEPRVSVHAKITRSPHVTPALPTQEPSTVLPEFELVTTSTPAKSSSPTEMTFADEDLFEVEKSEAPLPEFLEVTPKEIVQKPQNSEMPTNGEETLPDESNIPEWQPVSAGTLEETSQPAQIPKDIDSPEFERADMTLTSQKLETTVEQEPLPLEGVPSEPPVRFLPVESEEIGFETLTRKQKREAKRLQKKKERETKRQRKIERKQLKKEKRQKNREEKQQGSEQPLQQVEEKTASKSDIPSIDNAPQSDVDRHGFKGIESIDDKTAELLYRNGYFSIENVKNATMEDLVQIRGIKRSLAKQIKKEIERKITISENSEFIPSKQKISQKKSKEKLTDSSEWESYSSKEKIKKPSTHASYIHKGYSLYTRVTRKNGKRTTIYFFSQEKPESGSPCSLPEGYQVAVSKKTGMPYLKKKR